MELFLSVVFKQEPADQKEVCYFPSKSWRPSSDEVCLGYRNTNYDTSQRIRYSQLFIKLKNI